MDYRNERERKPKKYYLDKKYRLVFRSFHFYNTNDFIKTKYLSLFDFLRAKFYFDDPYYYLRNEFTAISDDGDHIVYKISDFLIMLKTIFISLLIASCILFLGVAYSIYNNKALDIILVYDLTLKCIIYNYLLFLFFIPSILCFINMNYINFKYRRKIYSFSILYEDKFNFKVIFIMILFLIIDTLIFNYISNVNQEFVSKLAFNYEIKYEEKFNLDKFTSMMSSEKIENLYSKLMLSDIKTKKQESEHETLKYKNLFEE